MFRTEGEHTEHQFCICQSYALANIRTRIGQRTPLYCPERHENKQTKNHNWAIRVVCAMCEPMQCACWVHCRGDHALTHRPLDFDVSILVPPLPLDRHPISERVRPLRKNGSNQFFMQSRFGLNLASVFHSFVSDSVQRFFFSPHRPIASLLVRVHLPIFFFFSSIHFVRYTLFASFHSSHLTARLCDLFLCQLTRTHSLIHSLCPGIALVLSLAHAIAFFRSCLNWCCFR